MAYQFGHGRVSSTTGRSTVLAQGANHRRKSAITLSGNFHVSRHLRHPVLEYSEKRFGSAAKTYLVLISLLPSFHSISNLCCCTAVLAFLFQELPLLGPCPKCSPCWDVKNCLPALPSRALPPQTASSFPRWHTTKSGQHYFPNGFKRQDMSSEGAAELNRCCRTRGAVPAPDTGPDGPYGAQDAYSIERVTSRNDWFLRE
jgi:hypothetical protein